MARRFYISVLVSLCMSFKITFHLGEAKFEAFTRVCSESAAQEAANIYIRQVRAAHEQFDDDQARQIRAFAEQPEVVIEQCEEIVISQFRQSKHYNGIFFKK